MGQPQPPLNPIQELNFTLLQTVRDVAAADLATACCQFGLSVEQARTILALKPTEVLSIVSRLGGETLFAPREDIDALLKAPAHLQPLLALARRRTPSRPAQAKSR